MVHQGKVQRWLLAIMLLAVNLPPLLLGSFPNGFALYFQLFVSALIVLALFIEARVKVRNGNISYRVELWGLPLYYKTVYAEEIKRIEFKRSNWSSKVAVVRVKKGIDLRFALFGNGLFGDLLQFAIQNNLELRKSKDYQTIEKFDSNRR
ncbi:hypothetical protein BBI15_11110 [Planococcus plakortidis]|uniref:DUF304 domain-containing protein n=1 Tax=Planococcus plakortidis TaxID=1038856 RepID=A0A1C7EAL7_9BACL|nr:hypothetical protein [Planococcus plakortidis]ANU20721.1 hypothetical protein BBI15_11110 [Planococcus plakortidis]